MNSSYHQLAIISEPIPETLKLPQNIFFWVCLLFYYLIEMGRIWLLTIPDPDKCDVLPLNEKMTFVWKQNLLQCSTVHCPILFFVKSNFLFT